jgi:hypothetical protein
MKQRYLNGFSSWSPRTNLSSISGYVKALGQGTLRQCLFGDYVAATSSDTKTLTERLIAIP